MVNIIKFVTFCQMDGFQQGNFNLIFILFQTGDE